jgi:hypothetical protein
MEEGDSEDSMRFEYLWKESLLRKMPRIDLDEEMTETPEKSWLDDVGGVPSAEQDTLRKEASLSVTPSLDLGTQEVLTDPSASVSEGASLESHQCVKCKHWKGWHQREKPGCQLCGCDQHYPDFKGEVCECKKRLSSTPGTGGNNVDGNGSSLAISSVPPGEEVPPASGVITGTKEPSVNSVTTPEPPEGPHPQGVEDTSAGGKE